MIYIMIQITPKHQQLDNEGILNKTISVAQLVG